MLSTLAYAIAMLMAQINTTPTLPQENTAPIVQETVVIPEKERIINKHDERQIRCLAENAYHEARGESKTGQIAVLNVVMNRSKDKRFPSTPCDVIKQRNKNGCQFSWVCHGTRGINQRDVYDRIYRLAQQVYTNRIDDNTRGAAFYHANYVRPSWTNKMYRTVQIGSHVFYKG